MNKGGFSVKRFIGYTRVKSNIARTTGVPFTTQGRNAKIGRAIQGNGSFFGAILLIIINLILSKK